MKKSLLYIALFGAVCVCFCLTLGYTAALSTNLKTSPVSDYHLLEDKTGWVLVTEEGSFPGEPGAVVPAPGGTILLQKEIFPEELGENILLFNNERQAVSVRADGEELFRVGIGERGFRFFTTGYCAVPLPEKERSYLLEIAFPGLEEEVCTLPEFFFGSMNDVMIFLCSLDIVTIVSIPLLALLTIGLAVVSVLLARRRILDLRTLSLSAFLGICAAWSVSDMELLCLTGLNMEAISASSHLLLAMLPLPIYYFVCGSCAQRKPPLAAVVHLALLANFFGQVALFLSGLVNLHAMLMISQGLLLLLLIYGTVAVTLDYRAGKTVVGKALVIAFLLSAVLGCLTVVIYWASDGSTAAYHAVFQLSLYLFLAAMLGVLMLSLEQYSYGLRLRDAELNAYRTISELDQLTGIPNRRSFDRLMEQIDANAEDYPNPTLVFMDLNGLKYTNDKFGHLAGDELIIAAARCIDRGFAEQGQVFRIGGDEFAAVITAPLGLKSECYMQMDQAIEEYNRGAEVPLSLARGSCALQDPEGKRLSVSDWKTNADKNMYRDKVLGRMGNATGSTRDYLEIISSFVSAVDAKDSYTANHSARVGILSDEICAMIGVSESSMNQIHIAACLHDIGKIGIPDSILLKEAKLTPEERQIMQNHSATGEAILKQTKAFYDVSQIIRHHHERFDGRGYPDGLAGAEIPLGARIIAIADSIDAMTSNRSYRRALPIAACKEEIRANLGVMYDSAIGSIVLENWDRIEKIILSHPGAETCGVSN